MLPRTSPAIADPRALRRRRAVVSVPSPSRSPSIPLPLGELLPPGPSLSALGVAVARSPSIPSTVPSRGSVTEPFSSDSETRPDPLQVPPRCVSSTSSSLAHWSAARARARQVAGSIPRDGIKSPFFPDTLAARAHTSATVEATPASTRTPRGCHLCTAPLVSDPGYSGPA